MSQKLPLQDLNSKWDDEDFIKSYQEAAKMDEFLFGDYDYEVDWLGKVTNDVT
jgi:hypothetical protein